jgi:hypothetical protein
MQRALDEGKVVGRELVTAGFGGRADLICSRQVSRLVARLRHADLFEQCPFTGLHRKTFAQAEFFSV